MNQNFDPKTTIAAVATPPGSGGVAMIRISGDKALSIADKIFSKNVKMLDSHTVHYGKIIDQGEILDEVLLVVMHAPRTFTGEDVIEIQCHGGSLITRKILEAILLAGATPAGPGEFTYRAFINEKIDLAQAEAIQTFIGAKNQLALRAAREQLSGKLSHHVKTLQKELIHTASILEAWVDFPEEGLEFASVEEITNSLTKTLNKMHSLEKTFHEGKKIHEGYTLCIAGAPNSGKSSLMNALLGQERAIVTPIPGTTRDLLESELHLGNMHYQLLDTAGIRETQEVIEKEGIRRSRSAMQEADFILLVIDATRALSIEDETLLKQSKAHKTLLIWNKIDLPHTIPAQSAFPNQIALSAKTGENLSALKEHLELMRNQKEIDTKDQIILTNIRHKEALSSAAKDLQTLIDGLKSQISPEFLSADMRSCLKHLSTILGIDITEEILSSIFKNFCVGK